MNLSSLFNLGNASLSPTTKYGTMVFLLVILLLSLFLGTYIGHLSPVREGNTNIGGSPVPVPTTDKAPPPPNGPPPPVPPSIKK
jgi:hypothetical protein